MGPRLLYKRSPPAAYITEEFIGANINFKANKPAADLIPGYYRNFIEVILQNIKSGWVATFKEHSDRPPVSAPCFPPDSEMLANGCTDSKRQNPWAQVHYAPLSSPHFFMNVEARVRELKKHHDIKYVNVGTVSKS